MAHKIRKVVLAIKSHYLEIFVTYLLAWASQAVSPDFVRNIRILLVSGGLGTYGMYALVAVGIFLFVIDKITSRIVFSQRIEPAFYKIMRKYTDDRISDSGKDNTGGGFSWGPDRTIFFCRDLINGWKPSDIRVAAYDDVMYTMKTGNEAALETGIEIDWADLYLKYTTSDEYRVTMERGNNLPRFMLTKCEMNYSKEIPQVFLSFKRTEWSQCRCVWKYFKDNDSSVKALLQKQLDNKFKSSYLPNSFCLHLLVETVDGKVVVSTISQYKENDYPNTIAATLGEQIESSDFSDGQSFEEPFVGIWVKRAFLEEFGLKEDQYDDLVDKESIRVLSIDMEGDIYNFTAMCVAKLKCNIDVFQREVACTVESKEIATISALSIDEIPGILVSYNKAENSRKYHPSTYLRLLMFYLHKKGIRQTEKDLIEMDRRKSKE